MISSTLYSLLLCKLSRFQKGPPTHPDIAPAQFLPLPAAPLSRTSSVVRVHSPRGNRSVAVRDIGSPFQNAIFSASPIFYTEILRNQSIFCGQQLRYTCTLMTSAPGFATHPTVAKGTARARCAIKYLMCDWLGGIANVRRRLTLKQRSIEWQSVRLETKAQAAS